MRKQQALEKKSWALAVATCGVLASGVAQADILDAYDFSYFTNDGYSMTVAYDTTTATFDIATTDYAFSAPITSGVAVDGGIDIFTGDPYGSGGTATLIENISNGVLCTQIQTGCSAVGAIDTSVTGASWTSWTESLYNLGDGVSYAGTPGDGVSWGTLYSSVAGSFAVNNATGIVTFTFATALAYGESFNLTKAVIYTTGVESFAVEHMPSSAAVLAVPEASTYGMMLSGLALVAFAVRRKQPRV